MTRPAATRLRGDYARWHRLQVATGDIDPVYPVLRRMATDRAWNADELAWLVLLHVAYYHLGSALAVFAATPAPAAPTPRQLRLPTGTERRGHRVPDRLAKHWRGLLEGCDRHGGPAGLLFAAGTDWAAVQDHLAALPGNGRWAAYKTGELAQKVCGLATVVADAGHAHSSGPRKGLALLHAIPDGNTPAAIARLDALTERLAAELGERDIALVETSLCDFHSLVGGGYYLGHDIDAMAGQLAAVPSRLTQAAMDARAAALPAAYLAERGGRPLAVDAARKRVYARTGRILTR